GGGGVGWKSGSVPTVFSSTAPIVFVYVAFSTSTVLPIGGTTPVHLSALRSPAHTTSKIFSKLWPLLLQPLTIWMRSRLPVAGSFTAHTMNVGALPLA